MRLPDKVKHKTVEFRVPGQRNPVRITMTLTDNLTQRRYELHCSGYFETNSGWAYAGQIADKIKDLSNDATYQTAIAIWDKYHDNTKHWGTPKQESLIREVEDTLNRKLNQKERKKLLKRNGLLYDKDHDGFDHMYGAGFTCHDIPYDDVLKIEDLMERSIICL